MEIAPILFAKSESRDLFFSQKMATRHGLIAGATGTGKTVSLRVLAEGFSRSGVPVFLADVKGDLSGLACAGEISGKVAERVETLGLLNFVPESFPVAFWDLFGKRGHPLRTTISEIGPLLLGRLLGLNETQSAALSIIFKFADDNGLLLLDLKDLKAVIQNFAENSRELLTTYGNIAPATFGAIIKNIIAFENQGGEKFIGEPALAIADLIRVDVFGKGVINIFDASIINTAPLVYTSFMLWLLSELFEELPEVGDLAKPKLVFFFDEAHLLFTDAPKELISKVEQLVRLIRSKGVGVYFVTQSPLDIPAAVLEQLGNRVQHALRAFTPSGQKMARAAADTFRANKNFSVAEAISELAIGEALVSFLDEFGTPQVVERALVMPPWSRLAPLSDGEFVAELRASSIYGRYEKSLDRESAYEILANRQKISYKSSNDAGLDRSGGSGSFIGGMIASIGKSALRSFASAIGREISRGLLGGIRRQR